MAIQPIDLQTLFTQMDKVGKAQSDQKEGLHLQQSLQGMANQKKIEEKIQSVNEAQDSGEGAERIKDKPRRKRQHSNRPEDRTSADDGDDGGNDRPEIIQDPDLGRNIDVSG
jgi:hypothetical protein